MKKINILAITPISTEELFKLRSECEALHDHIEKLLEKAYVETPKAEATPAPKAEPKRKPFEMIIE